MYALRVLRAHGFPADTLHSVARAIARLMYASPASPPKETGCMDRFYKMSNIMDYLPRNALGFPGIVSQADERLFRSVEQHPSHVLWELLSSKVKWPYNLWPRPHNYALPQRATKSVFHGTCTNLYLTLKHLLADAETINCKPNPISTNIKIER